MHLARRGGCAILAGDRGGATLVDPRLRTWPDVHARLALVEAGLARRRAPRQARGRVATFWVTAAAASSAARVSARVMPGSYVVSPSRPLTRPPRSRSPAAPLNTPPRRPVGRPRPGGLRRERRVAPRRGRRRGSRRGPRRVLRLPLGEPARGPARACVVGRSWPSPRRWALGLSALGAGRPRGMRPGRRRGAGAGGPGRGPGWRRASARLMAPWHWDELGAGIGDGIAGLGGATYPYRAAANGRSWC